MGIRVFISYRRGDDRQAVGRLRDRLADEFGHPNVFLDVDSVEIGEDFRDRIRTTIDAADVVLVFIGPAWEPARLAEPDDFVRLELAEALSRRKLVIPVLLEGGTMPTPDRLPPELAPLSFRNAARLRADPDFRGDVAKIVDGIQHTLGLATSAPEDVPTTRREQTPAGSDDKAAVRSPSPALLGPLTLHVLPPHHRARISSLAFSPDGSTLATADAQGETVLWDVATSEVIHAMTHFGIVSSVAFSPDGSMLAIAHMNDEAVTVRAVTTGETTRTFSFVGWNQDRYVAFSPDGALLVAGQDGGGNRVWDLRTGEDLHHSASASGRIAFNSDGSMIASNNYDHGVKLWSVDRGDIRTITTARPSKAIRFSPIDAMLAVGTSDGTIELCDPNGAPSHTILKGHSKSVTELVFTSDGTLLASASEDRTVRLWDPVSGAAIRALTGHSSPVHTIAFSPDRTTLVSAGGGVIFKGDNAIHLWTLASGALFTN